MRILQLVHGLPIGGTEVMVCHLVRGLKRRGIDTAVGCLDQIGDLGEELRSEGVQVELLSRTSGFDWGLPGRIAALTSAGAYDLVHAHQYTCFFYGALARPRSGKPLIFTEHGRFYPDRPSLKRRAFNFLFARRADRITAVSRGVRQSLEKIEGFDPGRIEVIYNGIEIERFSLAPGRSRAEARAELGLSPAARVVGTVGRLDRIKNQSFLIHALDALRKGGLDACLVVVGEGPELADLQALAGRLGLGEQVRFLGKRCDIDRILPAMDVFALSSFSEGTPMTLIEAMAASVPIVSTGVGGIPEVLTQGEDGLLVEGVPPDLTTSADPAGSEYLRTFVDSIRRVLTDPELASRLRRNALGRASRDFSLDVILGKYLALYVPLCGSCNSKKVFQVR